MTSLDFYDTYILAGIDTLANILQRNPVTVYRTDLEKLQTFVSPINYINKKYNINIKIGDKIFDYRRSNRGKKILLVHYYFVLFLCFSTCCFSGTRKSLLHGLTFEQKEICFKNMCYVLNKLEDETSDSYYQNPTFKLTLAEYIYLNLIEIIQNVKKL